MDYLISPIQTAYFTSPSQAFSVRIKLSIFMGIFASAPIVFYQFWRFIVPGLTRREAGNVFWAVLFTSLFFFLGSVFCYFIVVPLSIQFFLGFQTSKLVPLINIGDYISFVAWSVLAFGLIFELPVVSFFLGKLGLLSAGFLSKGRRYAVVLILIVSAILTPPDVFSQILMAIPLYVLYELSILVVRFTGK